jgi:hypothetical protein
MLSVVFAFAELVGCSASFQRILDDSSTFEIFSKANLTCLKLSKKFKFMVYDFVVNDWSNVIVSHRSTNYIVSSISSKI